MRAMTAGAMGRAVRGFTLVELMVTLVVFGVLLGVAVPNFSTFTASSRVSSAANDLLLNLGYARSEAVKRGSFATLCATANGTACGTNWSQGWMVFLDGNGDGSLDTGEEVLRRTEALSGGATVAASLTTGSASAVQYVTYQSDGTSSITGRLVVCVNSATSGARVVLVSATRPRVTTGTEAAFTSCSNAAAP